MDERGEGLIVQCPQCGTDVIVPPKSVAPTPPPPPHRATTAASSPQPPARMEVPSQIAQIQIRHVETAALQIQLATLSTQLKELQDRRADLIAKMMGHIDEVNHILEELGGLQGAEKEIHREWDRIVEGITTAERTGEKK